MTLEERISNEQRGVSDPRTQPGLRAPGPDGNRVATILARLMAVLETQGVPITEDLLRQISESPDPFHVLEVHLATPGVLETARVTAEEIEATVRKFHEDEWLLEHWTNAGRAAIPGGLGTDIGGAVAPGIAPSPFAEDDRSVAAYLQRYRELTTGRREWDTDSDVPEEPLSPEEAHKQLREEGFTEPVFPDVSPEVLQATQAVIYLHAQGVITEEVDYRDLLALESAEAIKEFVKENYDVARLAPGATIEGLIDAESRYEDLPGHYSEAFSYAETSRTQTAGATAPELGDTEIDEDHPGYLGQLPPEFRITAKGGQTGQRFGGAYGPGRITSPDFYEQAPEYGPLAHLEFFDDRLDPNVVIAYQTLLMDAGFLTEDDFLLEKGVPSNATRDALYTAMFEANVSSDRSWIESAERFAKEREKMLDEEKEKYPEPIPVYTPLTYMKPDADTLKQYVKDTFRAKLGREPTAGEVSGLIGSLAADYRAEFDALEAKNRAEFEAGIAGREATMVWDPESGQYIPKPIEPETVRGEHDGEGEFNPDPDNLTREVPGTREPGEYLTVGGGTVQTTDPAASFQERFETIFANELARNRYRETSREAFNDVQASIMMINRAIGGG